ncbi:MAG: MgtC/SapB family protein [Sphingomonadales bacterium]|nr:MgtC/SapB family protein [Sphingomonadales bacterium]MBD3774270.1 MgtC/SapB family protein [Paracoccaceae bacterium]
MLAGLDLNHATGIALGLALGTLVGIERGWSLRRRADGTRFAGIRTFALMGLAGGLAGALYRHAQGPAVVLLGAAALLVVVGYARTSRISDALSGTSGMVALMTLASGFLAGSGERMLATIIAVVMVVILTMRAQLHRWVAHLSEQELHSIARFALIAMVVLPLLPDAGYGPYDAWNPRQLWLVVVMVSGFSFTGYFAAKWLGAARANLATAATGAMVSSTAVTASMATLMRDGEDEPDNLAGAICLASVVMFLREIILIAVLAPFALLSFVTLVTPAALVSAACAAWFLRAARRERPAEPRELVLRNPFDLKWALLLTAMVMGLTLLARWALATWGDQGVALVLAISGTVDVDSAIITMGGLPRGALDPALGGLVIAIPSVLNTLFKAGVAVSIAGWRLGRLGALPLVATALAVCLTWAATVLLG